VNNAQRWIASLSLLVELPRLNQLQWWSWFVMINSHAGTAPTPLCDAPARPSASGCYGSNGASHESGPFVVVRQPIGVAAWCQRTELVLHAGGGPSQVSSIKEALPPAGR
jgi:hypothetical protein